ncbi:serine hydrolase [Rubrivirga sp. IMCC45206]|uniref:serine hydrolase n=1 Tax=Rubrivirga sp. IMCC45206 TaxID=3391614 RepID=UPI00398FE77F
MRDSCSNLFILCMAGVSFCAAATVEAQDLAERADALLTSYHDTGLFNGAVLVAEGDSVLYAAGFGEADMSWQIPNTPETRFRIASVTKQFTSALVLQLAEEGLVDLDTPVRAYLPEYPADQGDRVTVRHLLTHTAGIPNYTGLPEWDSIRRDPFVADSFITVFSRLPLEFEPGSRFRYSNSNYFVLGVLVEHVTGQSYSRALSERLLGPLGLDGSGTADDARARVVEGAARGYVRVAGGFAPESYDNPSVPYAAGMMYSTVGDLFRWTRALHGGQVFRQPETLETMLTSFEGTRYGYGYGIYSIPLALDTDTVRVVGHNGGFGAFRSELRYAPEDRVTVVVLDNANAGGDVGAVATALMRVFYDLPVERPRQPIATVLADVIVAEDVGAAVVRYRALRIQDPEGYDFAEAQLNRLGYAYLSGGEVETALRLFELNADVYPESANTHDSLGEAYLAAGDRERAIASYQEALRLDPQYASARAALDRLGVE